MKILAFGDQAGIVSNLMKNIPHMDLLIESEYSGNRKLTDFLHDRHYSFPPGMSHLEKILMLRRLAKSYDLINCGGWRCIYAYLAGVPYGIQFFGSELRYAWTNTFKSLLKKPLLVDVIRKASYVVVGTTDLLSSVRHIRSDAKWIPGAVDFDMFNETAKRINLGYDLPVFLSPSRIERQKGSDIIWEAVSMVKNDLIVLQIDWGFEPYRSLMIEKLPEKMRLIDVVPHDLISSYYTSSMGVVGQMGVVVRGYVELEAAACGAPVLCYSPDDTPFVPKEKKPETLAKYIDSLVDDKEFRISLAEREKIWVRENHHPSNIVDKWQGVWEIAVKK